MVRRHIDETLQMAPSLNSVDLKHQKPQPRNQKLQSLEAEMAGIEMSLATPAPHNSKLPVHRKMVHKHDTFPKSSTSQLSVHKNDDQIRSKTDKISGSREHHKTLLVQELELLKETLKEKDDLLKLFQQENETLHHQQVILPKCITKQIGNIHTPQKDGEKKDYRLKQISLEIENKETLLKSLHTIVEQLEANKDIDSSIHHAELEYKIAVEESALLTLKHQYFMLQSEINIEEVPYKTQEILSEEQSVYSFVRAHPYVILVKAEITGGNFGRYGFGVSACSGGTGIYIELVNDSIPLKRGDRLLEINNHLVFNKTEKEFKHLMSGLISPLHIVALRVITEAHQESNSQIERLEKENETLKAQNKELTENLTRNSENFSSVWTDLKNVLNNLKKDLYKESPNDNCLSVEEKDSKVKSEQSIQHLEALFEEKDVQLQSIVSPQPVLSTLKMDRIEPDGTEKVSDFGDRSPSVWESLQFSKKEDILRVLKDQIFESSSQKVFLDALLALVIDHAPHLLSQVSEKPSPQTLFDQAISCEEAWC